MKLLSVIHGPAFGGAHNQAARLAQPLSARGVATTVLLPDEAEAAAERLRRAGCEVVTMPLGRLRATPRPVVQARFAARLPRDLGALERTIRERSIDIVQVHGVTNPQGAFAARRAGAAVLWQLFDTRAPRPLRHLFMPVVRRLADGMTVWGRELARMHPGADRLAERTTFVYPPVPLDDFRPREEARAAARASLGLPGDAAAVGTVGVLNPQKGHEHLIRAARLVCDAEPDARFAILGGSSPAHGRYEQSLRDEVRHLGLEGRVVIRDPGTAVPQLLQALDLFALTSVPRSEGMPTAILEAMACAKPVIATDVGAVRELVAHESTGLVVPPLDSEKLAGALLRLLRDPDARARFGAAGLRRARAEFGLERLADLHASAYRRALAHQHARLAAA